MLNTILLIILSISYPLIGLLIKSTRFTLEDWKYRFIPVLINLIVLKIIHSRNPKIRKSENIFLYATYFIITGHSIYLSYKNLFGMEYLLQNFFIVFLCSLGFHKKYHLFYYLFFSWLFLIPTAMLSVGSRDVYYILGMNAIVYISSYLVQMHIINFMRLLLVNDKLLLGSLDQKKDGIIITTPAFKILYANSVAEKILEFNSEFLIGSRVNLPIPSEMRMTGDAAVIELSDGSLIEIKMIKVDRDGKPAFYIGLKDVTQKIKTEREREKERILKRNILNSSGEGVFALDSAGNIIYANPFALSLTGYADSELEGESFHDLFHHSWADGNLYEKETSPIQETLTDGVVNRINNEVFWKKNDTFFPTEYVSSPIKEEDGKIIGAVINFKDATERRKKEDAENKYKEELLTISESAMKFLELKNPAEIYHFIAESVQEMTGASGVIVNSFNTKTGLYTTAAIKGFKQVLGSIIKMIGHEIIGLTFPAELDRKDENRDIDNKLVFLPDGLYTIKYGNLNRKECAVIESMLIINKVYSVLIKNGGEIFGSIIILHAEEVTAKTLLEIFSEQASTALKRAIEDEEE